MGDYNKNPKRPFVVCVPNKIRKRIAMHETEGSFLRRMDAATTRLRKALALRSVPVAQKKGSLWSRFTGGIKNLLQNKSQGDRK